MSTLRLLWFFVWRMVLWGFALGALAGGAFIAANAVVAAGWLILTGQEALGGGSANSASWVYLLGAMVIFGALGSVVGLALGLLCGLLLFALTNAFFHPLPTDTAWYRRAAGWVCATASALALLADWFINGYPNANYFALFRPLPSADLDTPPELSALTVLVFVAWPTLLISLPMWFSGRRVASQYANKAGGVGGVNDPPGSVESPS